MARKPSGNTCARATPVHAAGICATAFLHSARCAFRSTLDSSCFTAGSFQAGGRRRAPLFAAARAIASGDVRGASLLATARSTAAFVWSANTFGAFRAVV